MIATAGKDKYGHFVKFGDFRSAMPDAKTADMAAAARDLYAALEKAKKQIHVFANDPSATSIANAYCAEIDQVLLAARGGNE